MRRILVLFLFVRCAVAVTPAFVQGAVLDGSGNSSSVSSVSVTIGGVTGGTTAGNAIIVRMGFVSTTADFNSCADDNGNTYSLAVQKANAVNAAAVIIAYAINIQGGSVKITCKTTGAHTFFSMYAEEWSGVYAVSVVDNSANATCSAATSVSYTLATNIPTDALLAVTNWSGGSGTKTVGSGWTSHNSTALAAIGTEDQVAGAAGNYTVALSWTSSTNCASAAVALAAGTPVRVYSFKSNVYLDNSSNATSFSSVQTAGNATSVTAGDGMFVWISFVGTSTADLGSTPCTDNLGNTYTLAVSAANANGGGAVCGIAYATNIAGGLGPGLTGQQITCTLSHGHSFFSIFAAEFSGVAPSGALDASGSATANSTAVSKTLATNFQNDLVIVAPNWVSAHGALTLGTGMFSHSSPSFANLGEEDFITGAPGNYTGSISYATSGQSVLCAAAFKFSTPAQGYILRRIAGPF